MRFEVQQALAAKSSAVSALFHEFRDRRAQQSSVELPNQSAVCPSRPSTRKVAAIGAKIASTPFRRLAQ